jgi:hypothetical protein
VTHLGDLEPVLHDGVYVYSMRDHEADVSTIDATATFREAEGTTVVVTEAAPSPELRCRRIGRRKP